MQPAAPTCPRKAVLHLPLLVLLVGGTASTLLRHVSPHGSSPSSGDSPSIDGRPGSAHEPAILIESHRLQPGLRCPLPGITPRAGWQSPPQAAAGRPRRPWREGQDSGGWPCIGRIDSPSDGRHRDPVINDDRRPESRFYNRSGQFPNSAGGVSYPLFSGQRGKLAGFP